MTRAHPWLTGALAAMLVLIAASGIVGWTQLRSTSRAYDRLVNHEARLTKDALEMRVAVNDQAIAVRGYILSRGDDRYLAPYARGRAAFASELDQARAKATRANVRLALETISQRYSELAPIYERDLALVEAGRFDRAVSLSTTQARPALEAVTSSIDGLVRAEAEALYRRRDEAGAHARAAENAILGVLSLALLAGSGAAGMAVRTARRSAGAEAEAESARQVAATEGALARVATAIANEVEPRAVLASAAEEAARLLDAAAGAILRFEPGHHSAQIVGAVGAREVPVGARIEFEPGDVLGHCLSPADTAHSAAEGGGDSAPSRLRTEGMQTELAVPIWVGGHAWGAVWVAWSAGATPPSMADARLRRFAELASASITGADARAHLAQLAHEDSLTGLANHRTFHEQLRAEVARARRHGRALSIVLFDIDHFKDVNDLHGHHVGDRVLRETADRLAGCARSGELIARIGGEEFAWILPEADGMDAYRAADRARQMILASPMAGDVPVTVSAGLCDFEHAKSGTELLRYAHGALFWAKAHGRNIVFRYTPEVVTELSADEQLEQLRRSRTIVGIRALARAVDVKDASTARHSERVAEISSALARALEWSDREIAFLREAALVHDVGKIGVPDAILFKPGQLDEAEYAAVKQHAVLSAQIVSDVLSEEQVAWVLGHHERWDGSGYPDGLAGEEIPHGARILSVADAWDVMTSVRPYSPARSAEEALEEVRRETGRHFCPQTVAALEQVVLDGSLATTLGRL